MPVENEQLIYYGEIVVKETRIEFIQKISPKNTMNLSGKIHEDLSRG
jgi:hypothetical protein